MKLSIASIAGCFCFAASTAQAAVFLNEDNATVSLVNVSSLTGGVIGNAIDLDAVTDTDQHSLQSHVWLSGGPLQFEMTFDALYDLTEFYFWNYYTEGFDVDSIEMTFRDAQGGTIDQQTETPALGANPSTAETFDIDDVAGVKSVLFEMSGTNNQVDFQNVAFLGTLSADDDPDTPVVPVPAGLPLLAAGLAVLGLARVRRRA